MASVPTTSSRLAVSFAISLMFDPDWQCVTTLLKKPDAPLRAIGHTAPTPIDGVPGKTLLADDGPVRQPLAATDGDHEHV